MSQTQTRSLLLILISILMLSQIVSLSQIYPRGWDVFYHLKIVELMANDGLAPYDAQSAGGRIQSYPPGYHVLMLSLFQLTGLRLELIGNILSPVFFALTLFAMFNYLGKGAEAVLGVLLFATIPEVSGAFSSSAMPQTLGIFAIVMALRYKKLTPLLSILLGLSHWLSAGIFLIFFWTRELWPDIKRILLWGAGVLASFTSVWPFALVSLWVLRKRKKELAMTAFVAIPILAWKLWTGIHYAAPSWGGIPDIFSYPYKTGVIFPIVFFMFFSWGYAAFQTLSLLLLSQTFPYVPVRFILFMFVPATAVFVNGLRARKFSSKTILAVTAILAFSLLAQSLESAHWIKPDIKTQDVDALRWLDTNTVSTVLAYKDSSAFWAYYYTDNPTVLDGFSEGVPDVYERMEDEFEFYASDTLRTDIIERWGIRYHFINKLEREMFDKIFEFTKFDNVTRLYQNNNTEVLYYPPRE